VKTSDKEVASDITQEAFMRVWDYLSRGNTIQNMRAFLYTTTHNIIKDWYKKKKAKPFSTFSEEIIFDIPDTKQNPKLFAELEIVFSHMKKLPEQYQSVLLMRFVEDMSPKDIAAVNGENENAVSVRINRALKQLRELMGEHDGR
jgi:RNA polymerase sigma-70 factor (ECF subfamily)